MNAPENLSAQTTRFGTIEIPGEAVVEFPDGLIGLGGHRYALIPNPTPGPFLWLQSLEDPAVALPVTNPLTFFPDFAVQLGDDEAARSGLDGDHPVTVYVTVTVQAGARSATANLKAPLVVRDGVGHQVINGMAGASVRAPLFGG